MELPKYSMGVGDRFGRQGATQLEAFVRARRNGIDVTPVWNKSHREHAITGTNPESVRHEADTATHELGWNAPYFVDADHIRMDTVDAYIASSDFFTIDVADHIGSTSTGFETESRAAKLSRLVGELALPGLPSPITISNADIEHVATKYAPAVREASRVYKRILTAKGKDSFVVEVSMDETDVPQSPTELLLILALIANEGIPVQTIAPKFTGRFNKGIDYSDDIAAFTRDFESDLAVVAYGVEAFGLPHNLKLSVHTGSDKFSLYPVMRTALEKFNAGVHLKTAGTTWLEELAALATAGDDGIAMARAIYQDAYARRDELCGPYAAVIDIDDTRLPLPDTVNDWPGNVFATMLRHDAANAQYNPHARQLLHLGFKIAAEFGDEFLTALDAHADTIGPNVTENLYDRHLLPLFSRT
jgi:hypothetical protein